MYGGYINPYLTGGGGGGGGCSSTAKAIELKLADFLHWVFVHVLRYFSIHVSTNVAMAMVQSKEGKNDLFLKKCLFVHFDC